MTLGEKIRQARLEAGLSQRQLCGEMVTRNMLSQIENGTARPSMEKLAYFAARLGKPISFFLEEDAVCSPNQALMAAAGEALLEGNGSEAAKLLENYRGPDPTFDREAELLRHLVTLYLAQQALESGKTARAAQLVEEMGSVSGGYCAKELERQRLLLLGRAAPRRCGEICGKLPSLDAELLLRARAALEKGNFARSAQLLDAAEDQQTPEWNFLRGRVFQAGGQFEAAAKCYHRAEKAYPEKSAACLEQCYRELGDFKQAYYYAVIQRE